MSKAPHLHARLAAQHILSHILGDGQPLDQALDQAIYKNEKLEARDRGFLRQLVTTVLRRLVFIDWVIDKAMDRPLGRKDIRVRNYLRLGVAQIMFMDTENFAAVDTTVAMVARDRHRAVQAKKALTNAVLRRIIREQDRFQQKMRDFPEGHLPKWLRNRWLEVYGQDTTAAIARSQMLVPPLDLSFKPDADLDHWASLLSAEKIGPQQLRLRDAGAIPELPGFEDGQWWVQDIAACLPALLAGDVAGKSVADLCAAPGGKTLQLAAAGANVTSVDISKHRLGRLKQNLKRTGLAAEVVCQDVLKWTPSAPLDVILLDAPCSATGTMRRSPDVAFHKSTRQIEELALLQAGLLDHAFGQLKAGGILIYCTCSLEPEEGEGQINSFLARTPSAKRRPFVADEVPINADILSADGDVRTTPAIWQNSGSMDGFFIARLTKSS